MLGVGVVLSPASPAPVWRLHCWRLLSAECCCWASHNLTSVSPHWPGPSLLPSLLQPPDSCPHGRAPEDWRLLLGLGHEGDQPGRQGVPGRVRRSAPAQLWCPCVVIRLSSSRNLPPGGVRLRVHRPEHALPRRQGRLLLHQLGVGIYIYHCWSCFSGNVVKG